MNAVIFMAFQPARRTAAVAAVIGALGAYSLSSAAAQSASPPVATPIVTATAGGDLSAAFRITFTSALPGDGWVLFGPGPGCSGLTMTASEDTGRGSTAHDVLVRADDLNPSSTAVLPGETYWFEVLTLTKDGVQVDDNGGVCYTVSIPQAIGGLTWHVDAAAGKDPASGCPPSAIYATLSYLFTNLCIADGDRIILAPGTYAGNITVNQHISIVGAGAQRTFIVGTYPVFAGPDVAIGSRARVQISGVTLEKGNTVAGGGIANTGTLVLRDSLVTGNRGNGGGGIYNTGTAIIVDSTVTGNLGGDASGGITNDVGGRLTLTKSTVSHNSSNSGAGIYNNAATTTLRDSTISDNRAFGYGGGIYNDHGHLTLFGSTVERNTAGAAMSGGGIYTFDGLTSLLDSTISGNSPDNCSPPVGACSG